MVSCALISAEGDNNRGGTVNINASLISAWDSVPIAEVTKRQLVLYPDGRTCGTQKWYYNMLPIDK